MTESRITLLQPQKPKRPGLFSGAFLAALLGISLTAFVIASYLFFQTARAIILNAPQVTNIAGPEQIVAEPGAETPDPAVADASPPASISQGDAFQLPSLWDARQPVNILLLGIDQRPGTTVQTLTDTMMLITIDPNTGNMGMLSLPRDLLVMVPGYYETTINVAHVLGYTEKHPGGGPALAKETVAEFTGQPVHYYVRVNFDGFRALLDEVGCIEIEVPFDIDDPLFPDNNYGYDPLFIPAGLHCMDAELALKYARTRHVDSDFGRMDRQQQVLLAAKKKVFSTGQLAHLITRLPTLLSTLSDSLKTDMPLSQQITLANLGWKLDTAHIRRLVIDDSMIVADFLANGKWVARPRMEVIEPALAAFFQPQPAAPADPEQSAILQSLLAENARIAILNGAPDPTLGERAAAWLAARGYNVIGYGAADRQDYAQTQMVLLADKPFTRQQLINLFAIGDANIRPGAEPEDQIDIRLILGADFVLPTP